MISMLPPSGDAVARDKAPTAVPFSGTGVPAAVQAVAVRPASAVLAGTTDAFVGLPPPRGAPV